MRVLFVAPYVPSRIRVRPFEWVRALARQGCRIHLVAVQPPEDQALDDRSVFEACEAADVFPLSRWRTLANAASALPSPVPIQAAYARQPAAEARIRALAASGGFDVVHVEHLRGALLVPSPCPVPTRLRRRRLHHPAVRTDRCGWRRAWPSARWPGSTSAAPGASKPACRGASTG